MPLCSHQGEAKWDRFKVRDTKNGEYAAMKKQLIVACAFYVVFHSGGCKNSTDPDTTLPDVILQTPQEGAVVSGVSILRAGASDNEQILEVGFLVDGLLLEGSEDTSEPFEYAWDTSPYETGSKHIISARALDTSHNEQVSKGVIVTVNNDAIAPSVVIVLPVGHAVVSELVLIRAVAVDDQGIAKVDFRVDGRTLENGSDSTDPYEFIWNTVSYEDGSSHVLTAVASDVGNNVTISHSVVVIIDNSLAVPTQVNILSIEYADSSFLIRWHSSPDDDFGSYQLYESLSQDLSGGAVIFTSNNRVDTTYTVSNVDENERRYYLLTITDTFGLSTSSLVRDALALPPGLVAYWSFDDGTAQDNSGNSHHGIIVGATPTKGIMGNALGFDGSGDYVEIPHDPAFNLSAKTIHFWFIKNNGSIKDTPSKVDAEGLIHKAFDTGLDRAFSFSIHNQSPPFHLVMNLGNESDSLLTVILEAAIVPQKWYQVVTTFDNQQVLLYLDGTLVASIPFVGTVVHNNSPIVLGKVSVNSDPTRFFTGIIDEVRIYDRVLSNDEIQFLFGQQ